jgi:hypothetical protein
MENQIKKYRKVPSEGLFSISKKLLSVFGVHALGNTVRCHQTIRVFGGLVLGHPHWQFSLKLEKSVSTKVAGACTSLGLYWLSA